MFSALMSTHDATAGRAPQSPVQFVLHRHGDTGRPAIEDFVRRTYHSAYGAHLRDFLPLLLELRQTGQPQAVLGMRPATMGTPLFLEHYLEQSIEQVIARVIGRPVARTDVVEIGNLAASRRGASPLLFLIMAAALDAAGFRWLAFTATPQVEKLVTRLQYRPLHVGAVDPQRLGTDAARWGTYYDSEPQLMCVPLAEALRAGRRSPAVTAALDTHAGAIAALACTLRGQRA